jgi:ubiquitin-activating enzyme E1
MASIDMNKFDRQIRTFGLNASQRLQNGILYIVGLKGGYAGEICKNMALSGINTINLVGNETIDMMDIKSSMYYRNSKIGDTNSIILKQHINELNSMVQVNILESIDYIIPNSVVVVINMTLDRAIEINLMCRSNDSKMIYMLTSGLAGSIFVDATNEHITTDTSGEIKETVQIKDIVGNTIFCNTHTFSTGDSVRFISLDGISSDYFLNQEWIVGDTNNHSFKILPYNMTNYTIPSDFKFINGSIEYIMKDSVIHYKMLSDMIESIDNITSNLINIMSNKSDMVDNMYLFTKDIVFEPVTSLMCGFVSTEVIKLITHKYTPISQWFTWSDHSIFTYDTMESVTEQYNMILDKLKNYNILMVGCGALGCEWLKNLAMLSCNNVDIVDPDYIEHSNLSRQFLFRSHHVKQSKCNTAINMIGKINNMMNLKGFEKKLSSEDIDFTNKIFTKKDIVINALDNITARRYVDSVCFNRNLPLFESGTMGMKCNTVPIIPFLTETYSNSNDVEEEKQFPVCTIKNFPNQIHHTIHWARDNFEQFNIGPSYCNKYIEDPLFLDKLSLTERNTAIDCINYYLTIIPKTWMDCTMMAIKSFEEHFINSIKQLLCNFPKDHMVNDMMFWSHGKMCPKPLDFIYNNIFLIDYLFDTTKILCMIYNIMNNFTQTDIIMIVQNYTIKDFIPKTDMVIATNDKEIEATKCNTDKTLNNIDTTINKLYPLEFEKEDMSHIDWITSASNCRATNYSIKIASKYETKGIAGRIIPAIATTTSTTVGLIGMELLRYASGCMKIDSYRSWFMNMADNTTLYSEPLSLPSIIVGGKKLNGWTKFNYNINSSLMEFIEYYMKMFDTTIYMVLYGSSILYSDFTENIISKSLIDIFKSYNINIMEDMVTVNLISTNDMIEIPPIIINL